MRIWLNRIEQKSSLSPELIEWLKETNKRMEFSTSQMDIKLAKNMELFHNRLDKASMVMAEVQKNIGEFSEIGRSMHDLQELLQSPKLRGNIGEQILKELLSQYFPPASYALQYTFKTGDKVDAVIKTTQGFIPIDSKFPLENFRKMHGILKDGEREQFKKIFIQDVKKHINDIARKYILTGEGTVDYAIMYIPSESVYYEIINDASLFEFAGTKRILPVSPLCFYAYMRAILMSFEGARIQSQAKEILTLLSAIKKDYEKADYAFSVLNKHIANAYNQTTQFSGIFTSLGHKLSASNLISSNDTQEKLLE